MATSDPTRCPTCGRGAPGSPQPPPIGERTPALVCTEQRLDRRQRDFDQARAAFDTAASRHYAAKATSWARTRIIVTDGGATLREVGGTDPAELAALAEAEEIAKTTMSQVGEELTLARIAHHEAARAARAASVVS